MVEVAETVLILDSNTFGAVHNNETLVDGDHCVPSGVEVGDALPVVGQGAEYVGVEAVGVELHPLPVGGFR